MNNDWLTLKDTFEVKDVRKLKGNFMPFILNTAKDLETGKGLCVVQSFEPLPLYSALEELGYQRHTERI